MGMGMTPIPMGKILMDFFTVEISSVQLFTG